MKGFICYKKRVSILILGLIFFLPGTEAQDLVKVQQLWQQHDLAAAREQVDIYTTAQPGDVQGWLLKAKIFNAISNDAVLQNSVADGRIEAIGALQKAVKLDLSLVTNELKKDSFAVPFQLYNGYSNDGIAAFNTAAEVNDKALYLEALSIFRKASLIGTIIYTNKWGLQAIDTNNIYYSAKAAIKAEKTEEAVDLIKKIADAHINETAANKGFESLYQWLVFNYRKQNNEAAMNKYTAFASVAFPSSPYFQLNYIDWLREQKKYDQLYPNYKTLFDRGFNKAEYKYAFLLDIYNYIYGGSGADIINPAIDYRKLLEEQLTIYTRQNPAAVNGKLLFGKFYINQAADWQKKILLTADAQIINAYRKNIAANLRSSNKYLREIADKFPNTNRAVYNEALQLLVSNFTALNQPALAKKYQAWRR
jgi:hypothetical protein